MNAGPAIPGPSHTRSLSRRRFVGATAGLALGDGVSAPPGQGGNPHGDSKTHGISGRLALFGVLTRHVPIALPGTPLANIDGSSQMPDFTGAVNRPVVDRDWPLNAPKSCGALALAIGIVTYVGDPVIG
jgi:hypothetical protein